MNISRELIKKNMKLNSIEDKVRDIIGSLFYDDIANQRITSNFAIVYADVNSHIVKLFKVPHLNIHENDLLLKLLTINRSRQSMASPRGYLSTLFEGERTISIEIADSDLIYHVNGESDIAAVTRNGESVYVLKNVEVTVQHIVNH